MVAAGLMKPRNLATMLALSIETFNSLLMMLLTVDRNRIPRLVLTSTEV